MQKSLKFLGKIISSVFFVILALLAVANLYIFAARKLTGQMQPTVFGWSSAIVVSGSMEPAVSVNDMVMIHEQRDYQVDDVIMFRSGGSLVTHRLIEMKAEGYRTKGDANNTADEKLVSPEEVVGKVVLTIPKAGVFVGYLQTPMGMTALVLIAVLLIALPSREERQLTETGGNDNHEVR